MAVPGPCPLFDEYPCGVPNPTDDPRAPYLAGCEDGKKHDMKRLGYNLSSLLGVLFAKTWDELRDEAPA